MNFRRNKDNYIDVNYYEELIDIGKEKRAVDCKLNRIEFSTELQQILGFDKTSYTTKTIFKTNPTITNPILTTNHHAFYLQIYNLLGYIVI